MITSIRNTPGSWNTQFGCSSGLSTLYTEYQYWTNPDTKVYYRFALSLRDGGDPIPSRNPDPGGPSSINAEELDYFPCFTSANVPWDTINVWFQELLTNAGYGPYRICSYGAGSSKWALFHSCDACGGYDEGASYLGRAYIWQCK